MCVGGVVSDLGITQSNRVSAHAVTSVQPINFFTHPPQRSKGVAKSVKKLFFGMKSPGDSMQFCVRKVRNGVGRVNSGLFYVRWLTVKWLGPKMRRHLVSGARQRKHPCPRVFSQRTCGEVKHYFSTAEISSAPPSHPGDTCGYTVELKDKFTQYPNRHYLLMASKVLTTLTLTFLYK